MSKSRKWEEKGLSCLVILFVGVLRSFGDCWRMLGCIFEYISCPDGFISVDAFRNKKQYRTKHLHMTWSEVFGLIKNPERCIYSPLQ